MCDTIKAQKKKECNFMEKRRIELRAVNVYGVEEKLIDRFYFRNLIMNLLEYDEFVKELDKITGFKISNIKTLEERQEEIRFILGNGARGAIAVHLAIKYLSYLVDKGLDVILDDYWRDRLNKFKGFGNE
jgi:transcription antitermination factor NusG